MELSVNTPGNVMKVFQYALDSNLKMYETRTDTKLKLD